MRAARRLMSKDPVVLVTVYNPIEAEVIKAKLRDCGIEVFSRQETVYRLTVDGMGAIEIIVDVNDLEKAKEILKESTC